MSVDLVNRDPNNINEHLQSQFEDVIAEPDGTHSIDCVWKLSHACFECWKGFCYKTCTLLCGLCIAASWGCDFAYLTFLHVWCYTPRLKTCEMNCMYMKKMYSVVVGCCVEPCCIACGMVFHQFKKS